MRNLESTTSSRFVGGNCVFQCRAFSFSEEQKCFKFSILRLQMYFWYVGADFRYDLTLSVCLLVESFLLVSMNT